MSRPRTAQIKPATRDALMDQLALAANEIIRCRHRAESAWGQALAAKKIAEHAQRLWWHKYAWWRA